MSATCARITSVVVVRSSFFRAPERPHTTTPRHNLLSDPSLRRASDDRQSFFCNTVSNHTHHIQDRHLPRALINHRLAGQAVIRNNTKHESSEPHNHAQEREGLRRLPLSAVVAARQTDSGPRPRAAAVCAIEPAHQHRESCGPTCRKDLCVLAMLTHTPFPQSS